MATRKNRYSQIIEHIFAQHYKKTATEVPFDRNDIISVAKELQIVLPKNLGDVIYSFRYRSELPARIQSKAPKGSSWIIRPAGKARYKFVAVKMAFVEPSSMLVETKILDATPGVIEKYALSDEQALLAKIRYNRLVDIFTGIACYSLQSHLRTTVRGMGQVETDEIYIGVDKKGAQYILPIQAKGGSDRLNVVQIEQDIAVCKSKFPKLICRALAAQFMASEVIALFEFELSGVDLSIADEKHYRLVRPDELSDEELEKYKKRSH